MSEKNVFERIEDTSLYRFLKYGMNRRLIRFLLGNVSKRGTLLSVAEIGCGSGYASHLLGTQEGVKLSVALDINMELFSQSDIRGFGAAFVVGDVFSLPFRPDSFDLVYNSSALEHLHSPQDALGRMAEITKPGGLVFVGVPYLFGPLAFYYLAPLKKWREWLGRPYTFDELETLFTSCGLRIEKRLTYFMKFFAGVLATK